MPTFFRWSRRIMDYLAQLEKAVNFIEENLEEEIDVKEIAGTSGYSYFHFTRVFQAVAGQSLGEYLRRRRLARAAAELVTTRRLILDIALEYGFESQEAFHRAFQKVYGTSPGVYRHSGILGVVGDQKPLNVSHLKHLREGLTLQPEIRTTGERRVVGIRGRSTLADNRLPDLWRSFQPRIPEIPRKKFPWNAFGICEVDPGFDLNLFSEETESSELVGVEVETFGKLPSGMDTKVIPPGKFAVFTHTGSIAKLGITYDYIWGTWVPCSGVEVDQRDDFELYDQRFLGPENEESQMEIWVPVK